MAETLSFIDTTDSEPPESLAPADTFSFTRVEFHVAKKKPSTNGGDYGSFCLETLNPTTLQQDNNNQQIVGSRVGFSGAKRDASELDQEPGFGGITFRRIGAGLENLGNTCFLNSVLQCLTYTEPLAAYLQSGKHQVTCRKSGFCALCAIQKHVSRALQLSGRSLAPKDLVSNLRRISRTFRNSRQEDAHEYMVNLLESMHKCCLPNGEPSESQSAYDKSLVHKIFGGQLRSQVKCLQCNHCSNKFDPFLDLSLEILKAGTLYKALANFTAKEQLDGGAKQYQCQQCKQKVKALKQLTVYKAPNVLTIHLKRFGCLMSGQKIDKKIHFGHTLDLKPFVTGPYDGDLKYTLYGVLVHAGWSTHSGHYYCFVRTSSGMWYSLDDNQVFQVSEKTIFEQKAYMLFYVKDRQNSPSKKPTDVHHKEKMVMNGTPRETQMKMGPSNCSLNAQMTLKKSVDVALQKENIVMNGTPNVPGASREAQMNTVQSNGSLDAHVPLATVGTDSNERSCSCPVASKEIQTNTVLSDGSLHDHESLVSAKTLDGSDAPNEAQMITGLSDGLLNAQQSLATVGTASSSSPVASKVTQTDTVVGNGSLNDHESLVSAGTLNGSGAPKEAHMKMGLSDGSLDAQQSLATVDSARSCTSPVASKTQTNTVLSNGSLNDHESLVSAIILDGSGAPKEAQMKMGLSDESLNAQQSLVRSCSSPVASKETQTNTVLSNGSLNDHESLVSARTLNGSGAPKEAQIKTGLSDESLNAQKLLAAVVIKANGFRPVAPKESQTNSNISNVLLSGQNSSAVSGSVVTDFSTGASEPERTQMKEAYVPKSISKPSKTENHTKEFSGGVSSGGNNVRDDDMEATALPKPSDLSKMEKKAFKAKSRKKLKNFLKCNLISMKFSSNVLMGTSLNQRKKKKNKRNKQVKNLAKGNLVNEGPSLSVKTEALEIVKPFVDNGFKERIDEGGTILATSDFKSGSQLNPKESNRLKNCRRSMSQKDLVHMLTRGIDDRTVPRWDDEEPGPSQIFREERNHLTIGYIGDAWDEDYDNGKRKKVKISKTEFDGKNSFQDIANARLKSVDEKQNLSKTQPMMTKRKNKHFKRSRFGNGLYRIRR